MFYVYEVFKSDGKTYFRYKSEDKFDCEVYINNHKYDYGALLRGASELKIFETVQGY